ncbi:MAG: SUMF1/EgtB/PvdO family nonheme iron enzyme [Planctomycetes bacterium]|nr:SUMF1/EgtB/PvdO family nonheme iron enzyme [Planctomycetota bacterium]
MHIPIAPALALAALLCSVPGAEVAGEAGAQGEKRTETLAGTTVTFEMARIPAGTLAVEDPAAPGGARQVPIESFWMAATEVTWDAYDVFVFGLDLPLEEQGKVQEEVDAHTRPTKPYIATDRGFGHAGYPAISISHQGAEAYCAWLTKKTGRTFRLPTAYEWEYACRAGATGAFSCGDDEAGLDAIAWHAGNAERKTHPVGTKQANAFGLFDMHGNAGEWCLAEDGKHYLMGGSFEENARRLRCATRREPSRMWNASDPQIPRSTWWLADGPFAGFRVISSDAPPCAAKEQEQDKQDG